MKNGNVYVDSEDNVEKHLQQLKELLKDPKCKLDILPRKRMKRKMTRTQQKIRCRC